MPIERIAGQGERNQKTMFDPFEILKQTDKSKGSSLIEDVRSYTPLELDYIYKVLQMSSVLRNPIKTVAPKKVPTPAKVEPVKKMTCSKRVDPLTKKVSTYKYKTMSDYEKAKEEKSKKSIIVTIFLLVFRIVTGLLLFVIRKILKWKEEFDANVDKMYFEPPFRYRDMLSPLGLYYFYRRVWYHISIRVETASNKLLSQINSGPNLVIS